MKPIHWLFIILTAVAVILAILFFLPEKKFSEGPFPPGPNIRISTTPFQKAASPIVIPASPTIKPDTSAMANLVASVTAEEVTAFPVSSTAGASSLCINISDALGDPIPKGAIVFQGKERTFYGGLLLCNDIPNGVYELAASAEGYSSVTGTVDISKTHAFNFILEYTSTHGVTVYTDEKQKNPCAGADVYLWKGPVPKRPVQTNTGILVEGATNNFSSATFAHDAMGIHVESIQKKYDDHLYKGYPGGNLKPHQFDVISGVDLCNWNGSRYILHEEYIRFTRMSDPVSPHLRMWDVLAMADKTESSSLERVLIRFLHKENEYGANVLIPSLPVEKTLVQQGKTDGKGQCVFSVFPLESIMSRHAKIMQRAAYIHFCPPVRIRKLSYSIPAVCTSK